ncbi:MAG: hypothetical protein ACI835_003503 [Planctomycetota bacterium]|jgi:hypothetical protein
MRIYTPIILLLASISASAQGRTVTGLGSNPSAIAARCAARPLSLPSFSQEIGLQAHVACNAANAQPFGAAFTSDGSRLYTALLGGLIGSGGCTLVRIDPLSHQVVATISTGEGPEEIAFIDDGQGRMLYGFVTNSADSSVTVFDASDAVVTTIPIPFDAGATYPTAFPFGLCAHPNQSIVYVGTLDGQGIVHAIDVATLALDPAHRIELGAQHGIGRMAFAEGRLVLTATEYFAGYTGSTAKVCVVAPDAPGVIQELALATHSAGFLFPSAQDVAIDCDGLAWVAGFDMGARVFAVDPFAPGGPAVVRRIRTNTSQPNGKFQALGLSPDGLLCVADLWSNELSWINVRRRQWIGTTHADDYPAFFRAPQEISFDPSGRLVAIPWAASDNLMLLDI